MKIDNFNDLNRWLATFSPNSQQVLNNAMKLSPYASVLCATDGWWVKREHARMMYEFGQVYQTVPVQVFDILAPFGVNFAPFHFVHLSNIDATKIAFTASWEDGVADRQQQISLGKYIKKYHPQVPEFAVKQCQELLNNLIQNAEVKFTSDLETMIRVYKEAAPACMSKSSSAYNPDGLHPLACYAGVPGLRLAYLEDTTSAYARSLVYDDPDDATKKFYVRVYGDSMLTAQLSKLGYTRRNLEGIKLKKIRARSAVDHSSGYLCPYIDDHESGVQGTGTAQRVLIKDDHLLVVSNKTPGALETKPSGWIPKPRPTYNIVEIVKSSEISSFPVVDGERVAQQAEGGPTRYAVFFNYDGMRRIGLMEVSSHDDLDEFTIKDIYGSRYMNNPESLEIFQIGVVYGFALDQPQYVSIFIGGPPGATKTQKYVALDSQHYSVPRINNSRRPALAKLEDTEAVVIEEGHMTRALKSDVVLLTGGESKGKYAHKSKTVEADGLIYAAYEMYSGISWQGFGITAPRKDLVFNVYAGGLPVHAREVRLHPDSGDVFKGEDFVRLSGWAATTSITGSVTYKVSGFDLVTDYLPFYDPEEECGTYVRPSALLGRVVADHIIVLADKTPETKAKLGWTRRKRTQEETQRLYKFLLAAGETFITSFECGGTQPTRPRDVISSSQLLAFREQLVLSVSAQLDIPDQHDQTDSQPETPAESSSTSDAAQEEFFE